MYENRESHGTIAWDFMLFLIILDSLITYLFRSALNFSIPINAIFLVVFVILLFQYKYPWVNFSKSTYIGIYLFILSYLAAIISVEEFSDRKLFQLFGMPLGLFVGYAAFASDRPVSTKKKFLSIIGILYCTTCTIALLNLLPQYFPLIQTFYFREGVAGFRPEITTDQNLQVLYLLPAILLFAVRNSTIQLLLLCMFLLLSIFILGKLETRSGTLVTFCTFLFALFVGTWSRKKIDLRFVFIFACGLVVAAVYWAKILNVLEAIYLRFTVDDFDTFDARLNALGFVFENLFNVDWWFPRGFDPYKAILVNSPSRPHAAPAVIYIESGILGLIGWTLLVIVPLIKLALRWKRRETDEIADIALCGGVAVFIVQLSLPEATTESIWLWAGAVLGALGRQTSREHSEEEAAKPRGFTLPTNRLAQGSTGARPTPQARETEFDDQSAMPRYKPSPARIDSGSVVKRLDGKMNLKKLEKKDGN